MHTYCTQQQLTFQPLRRRKVVADFSAGRTSSDGGALLLRELDERFGLTDRLADCFVDHRDQRYVDHSVRELLRQRIYGLCLGYEDLNDHDRLRHDVLLAAAVGKCEPAQRGPRNDVALAGSSTLNRLELATRESAAASRYRKLAADPEELKEFFVDAFIDAHVSERPERLILDFDASDIELHGKQEERFYQGYYNHYCYLPLYVFCGEHLLVAELRPSNIDGSKGTVPILEWLVPRLRARWPGIEIIVRADSGFSREAIFSCCEDLGIDYVIGIARNKRLQQMVQPELAAAAARHAETGRPARVYGDLRYRTNDSWTRGRRVVCKAEQLTNKANPRFVVTSYTPEEIGPDELYAYEYCARGESENRIKEAQLDLFGTRTSCKPKLANQVRVWLSAAAYTLMVHFRAHALRGTQLERAQTKTIRARLFKVAARVRVSARRVVVQFSSSFPLRDVFVAALANIQASTAPT